MPEPTSEAATTLGNRIRDERNKQGYTQEEVAYAAVLNVSNFGKIERGQGNPRFETIIRIAGFLGVDLAELTKGISVDKLPKIDRPATLDQRIERKRQAVRRN